MLLGGGLVGLFALGLWIYALYDVVTTEESLIRNLPKGMWLLLVIFLFQIGAIIWFIAGRPQGIQLKPYTPPAPMGRGYDASPRPVLDDPGLAGMDPIVRHREEQARLRMWEEQLRRKEEELRRKELGIGDGADRDDDPGR